MNVIEIVVHDLPEYCNGCQFHIVLDYVGKDWCTAYEKVISERINYVLQKPSWCPLVLQKVAKR
jgi:hypothetical protein